MPLQANRIKELRLKLGLSQEEVADRANLSQRAISRYENGENDPTGNVLISLARVFGTSTDWLLGVTDDPSPHFTDDQLKPAERKAIAAWRRGDRAEAAKIILNG